VTGVGAGEMLLARLGERRALKKLYEMLTVLVVEWGADPAGVMLRVANDANQERFVQVLDAFAANWTDTVGFID
jgi:hypothetical protein